MRTVSVQTLILLLGISTAMAQPAMPGTKPHLESADYWINRAVNESKAMTDLTQRSQLLCNVAQLEAWAANGPAAERLLAQAEALENGSASRPVKSPSEQMRIHLTPLLVKLKASSGDAPGARQMAERFARSHESRRSAVYSSLATALAGQGNLHEAMLIAARMNQPERQRLHASIVRTLAESRQFDEARRLAQTLTDAMDRRDSLNFVAQKLAAAGKYSQALEMAATFPSPDRRRPVYFAMVQAQARTGDYAAAIKTAMQMLPDDKRIDVLPPDIQRMNALIFIARTQLSRGLINQAIQTTFHLNERRRPEIWIEIARSQMRAGQFAAARRALDQIPPDSRPRNTQLMSLTIALAKSGDFTSAKEVAMHLPRWSMPSILKGEDQQINAILAIGQIAEKARKLDVARTVIAVLEQIDRQTNGRRLSSSVRDKLAALKAACGDNRLQQQIMNQAEHDAVAATNPEIRLRAQIYLFGQRLNQGDLQGVAAVVKEWPGDRLLLFLKMTMENDLRQGKIRELFKLASILPTTHIAAAIEMMMETAMQSHQMPAIDLWVDQLPAADQRASACLMVAKWLMTHKDEPANPQRP